MSSWREHTLLCCDGTLIYLDPREYTWCVPANRVASVFAVMFSSYVLNWIYGVAAPGPFVLTAAGVLILAVAALSFPAWRPLLSPRPAVQAERQLLLFVCGGNTCRSAMAEAVARSAQAAGRWRIRSAGLQAIRGASIASEAVTVLADLGVTVNGHQARRLTPDMIAEAHTVYTMTAEQRDAVVAMAP